MFKYQVLKRLDAIESWLDAIIALLQDFKRMGVQMAKELDDLTTQVKANTDAEASAITLLNGLSDLIASLKTDPVKLQQLSNDLKAQGDALAAAVVANTPKEGRK